MPVDVSSTCDDTELRVVCLKNKETKMENILTNHTISLLLAASIELFDYALDIGK